MSDHALEKALEAFGLRPLSPPAPIENSVLNQNYRVDTAGGPVFLRSHRPGRPLERLQRELAGAAWAASRGLPVSKSRLSPDGRAIVDIDGQFWSVQEWVDGATYLRGSVTPEQAHRLGAVHARCLVALDDYPGIADLPPNSELSWSTEASLAILNAIGPEVARRGNEQEQRWHATQTELLRSPLSVGPEPYAWMPRAATHGDFHDRNVMFEPDGALAAVVDWERFCVQPPAFEVLRAVSFMLILEPAQLRAYVEGFREHATLVEATIPAAVDAWWQSSLHNTWSFRDTFRDGNTTARQFLPEEERRSEQFNEGGFREWLTAELLPLAQRRG